VGGIEPPTRSIGCEGDTELMKRLREVPKDRRRSA
jgi:hypothetical protein